MIPVSLTIKGLYSYQKEQHIDFSKLMEGQLFGIFGTVGSGKSSILEAISYALYGDTERMNRNDNRSYNMMNLKSNELLIDFIFDNYDNTRYRFLVRGKRNSKNFDKVGTLERNAYKLVNDNWLPLESASGEEIIGLSYDNFRRTIIIPQGKFQEFLQLGDSERTRMLKDIFQLEKYEFFYQTAALEKNNQEAIHLLNGELAVYSSISEEIIAENEQKVKELKTNLKELQVKLDDKEKLFKQQEQVKQWHSDLENCQQLLQGLEQKEFFYKDLRTKIQDFEYCSIHFKELINTSKRSKAEIEKLEASVLQLSKDLELCNKRLVEDETELAKWKNDFDLKDINRSKLEDYNIAIKVFDNQKELDKITERIPAGEKYLKEVVDIKNSLSEQLAEKRNSLKQKKAALPDLNMLSEIRAWFVKYHHEKELLDKEKITLENKNLELKVLEENVNDIFENELLKDYQINSLNNVNEVVDQHRLKLHKEEKEHRDLLTAYQVQVKLGEFSSTLKNGEPCLLCGSLEHPQILIAKDVQEHLDLCEQKLENILNEHKSLNDIAQQIALLSHQKADLEQQFQKTNINHAELENRIKLLEKDFIWQGFTVNDENIVLQQFNDARDAALLIKSLEQDEEKIQLEIAEAESRYNKYKEGVENLHKQAGEKQSDIRAQKQQLKVVDKENIFEESREIIESKISDLKNFINEVEVNYERCLNKLNTEQQNQLLIKERLFTTQERLKTEKEESQSIQSLLDNAIAASVYETVDVISEILNQDIDLNQEKEELSQYEQQLYSCKENHKNIKALLADHIFIPEEYTALISQISLLKEEHRILNNDLIKTESILVQQQKDHHHKLNLEKQLQLLINRSENINILKNLFKGSGFVSYISSVYLNQLCAAANERFYKLSRQQLRLEVTDKNDFQVRDYLNDGRVRSVKTLSGGQTFQASLALALALAESVQQQNKSMQNFFFLDEGFGSLDKESLQIAFDTLKSLRKENRLVGVISHVEELQQEIDVFLKVSNSSLDGSTIKGSWE